MARRSPKEIVDKLKTEPPDTLELIGRLLVGSSYRIPVEGKGSKSSLQPSDVAAAVGYMRNPLQRATVVAVATRADLPEIARLSARAYRRVMREVLLQQPRPLDMREGADRWRLRMITYDAAFELVWPERRRPYALLAHAAKMRKASYITVHRCATSVLQQALNEGRNSFRGRLFGRG